MLLRACTSPDAASQTPAATLHEPPACPSRVLGTLCGEGSSPSLPPHAAAVLSLPACQPLSTWQVALKQLIPDNEVSLFGGALKFRAKVAWRAVCFGLDLTSGCIVGRCSACSRHALARLTSCSHSVLDALTHASVPPAPLPLLFLQHLPGLYVLGASAAASVIGGATRIIPFTLFGSYFAWAYLRFVQMRNGVRWEAGCSCGLEGTGAGVGAADNRDKRPLEPIRLQAAAQAPNTHVHPAGVAVPPAPSSLAGPTCRSFHASPHCDICRRETLHRRPQPPAPPAPSSLCRGDLSDEFRLASFFPQLLHPAIDRLAAACTRITGLGNAAGSQQHQAAWRSALVGGAALPGSLDVADDAARRRWVAGRGCMAVTASIIRGCVEIARQLGCCWRCGVAQAGAKGLLVLLRCYFATACV